MSARWSIPAQVNGLSRHGGDEEVQEQDVTKGHNVGFALMSEHSSYNAALGLARVVQERGHNPIFFVSDQTIFSQFVRTHGFQAAAIPPGHESHFAKPDKIARFRLWKRLQNRAASIRVEQDFLVDLIRTNSLDLCFVDAVRYDLYPFALALAKAGVPTMLLSYTFASRFGTAYPPVFSAATPPGATGPNARSSAMHALHWAWALGTRGRSHAFGRAEYAQLVAKKWLDQMRNVSFERELRRCGRRSAWSEWKRRPLIPEVVFGHRTLDWPAIASDPGRYYFGTTDLFRQTSDFDWSIVDPNKPVVYCNLSTINGFENIDASGSGRAAAAADPSVTRFRMAKRYVETVLRCFAQRPEWQLLIACGPFYPTLQDAALTPNIHLFERLPQLAVLERADLAITWGGAGTVRECINHGVPMVVLPAWTDQFGNAARVVARNVGVRGDLMEVTPETLMAMVERGLTDQTIRTSLSELRMQCNASQEMEGLLAFVGRHTGLKL